MTTDGSRFAADWLALREPVDHRSRSPELVQLLASWLGGRRRERPAIVDLGAGSGSNFRYLDARLPQPLAWRLLDHDAGLLAAVLPGHAQPDVAIEVCDFQAGQLERLVAGADVVTASALLDLTSADWIAALCAACARHGAALLVALTVDGRVAFGPPDATDAVVRAEVERDQRRDKGLGRALGGGAPAALRAALARCGYRVIERPSDWRLERADAALARAWIAGWAEAAARQCPEQATDFTAWAARRTAALADGALALKVGHQDMLGLPP